MEKTTHSTWATQQQCKLNFLSCMYVFFWLALSRGRVAYELAAAAGAGASVPSTSCSMPSCDMMPYVDFSRFKQ